MNDRYVQDMNVWASNTNGRRKHLVYEQEPIDLSCAVRLEAQYNGYVQVWYNLDQIKSAYFLVQEGYRISVVLEIHSSGHQSYSEHLNTDLLQGLFYHTKDEQIVVVYQKEF